MDSENSWAKQRSPASRFIEKSGVHETLCRKAIFIIIHRKEFDVMMKGVLIGSALAMTMLSGCQSYTSRHDVREARRDVRDAYRYGDRRDQREARRNARETHRDYQNDNRCGPAYGRPC